MLAITRAANQFSPRNRIGPDHSSFSSISTDDDSPPTALKVRPRSSKPEDYLTNVLSMSDPPYPSKGNNATTIKCLNIHHDFTSSLPPSQTRTKPITSEVDSAIDKKSGTTIPIERVRKAGSCGETSPLLSEREKIFATHYLPSDSNEQVPLLPAAEGADDVATLPQGLKTDMEFALPPSPLHSPTSWKIRLSPRKSKSSATVNNVGQKKLRDPSTTCTKGLENSRGTIHTVRRMASEGSSGKQILQLRATDQNHPPSVSRSSALVGRGEMGKWENDGDEVSGPIREISQARRDCRSAMRESSRQTSNKERSSSRGRSHVEKSIEATLPNREPAKNVRARKSSHMMGIFKEIASSESKKRDIQSRFAKPRPDEGAGGVLDLENVGISELRSQSALSTPSDPLIEEPCPGTTGVEVSDQPINARFSDLSIQSAPSVSVALSDKSKSILAKQTSPFQTEHDPYFRKRDEVKHSTSGKRPVIPAKLLEDIRKHHNLIPTGDRAALSHSLPSLVDVDNLEQQSSTKDVQAEDPDDQDEEDEEHISSAVYFPHPRPSDEEIDLFTAPDEDKQGDAFSVSPPSTPKVELRRSLSEIAPSEHIDISVKSRHEKSVFHGEYRPPEELVNDDAEHQSGELISETAVDSASSASDSEISSGEEVCDLGQVEEGEVTPTSTPATQGLLQRRKRTPTTTGLRGAVVLEPFSHQVGGHSTLFRFSRRAVCKQLNNRENEFYERIEQRHPDMLRFLPRFVLLSCLCSKPALECINRKMN